MPSSVDIVPRKGLIFMETDNIFAVAFDDLNWKSYPANKFAEEFIVILGVTDMDPDSVRSVLLGIKASSIYQVDFSLKANTPGAKRQQFGWES
eukprot:3760091-Pleurochrysis_carterae.AAC.1